MPKNITKTMQAVSVITYWTAAQAAALQAQDNYCATLFQGNDRSEPNFMLMEMRWEAEKATSTYLSMLRERKVTGMSRDTALEQMDYVLDHPQAQSLLSDFPMSRADRLTYGDVDVNCPELCYHREHTEESQEWALVETGSTKYRTPAERYANSLLRQGKVDAARFVIAHPELWANEDDKEPITVTVPGYLREQKGKLQWVPTHCRVIGHRIKARQSANVRWVKSSGLNVWAKTSSRIPLNFGCSLLVGMLRKYNITPFQFYGMLNNALVGVENPNDIQKLKSRMWDFFHKVMHRRNPNAYKAWIARKTGKNS